MDLKDIVEQWKDTPRASLQEIIRLEKEFATMYNTVMSEVLPNLIDDIVERVALIALSSPTESLWNPRIDALKEAAARSFTRDYHDPAISAYVKLRLGGMESGAAFEQAVAPIKDLIVGLRVPNERYPFSDRVVAEHYTSLRPRIVNIPKG